MAGNISAFTITPNGNWPLESYQVNFSDRYINPNAGFVPAENSFRYLNSPLNETDKLHTPFTSYNKALYQFIESASKYALDTTTGSSFTWNMSNFRKTYNVGPQFNYFYVYPNPDADNFYQKYYAYLLYPSRLFLRPTKLTKNPNNTWSLSTSAVLANHQTYFFSGSSVEDSAYQQHLAYLATPPSFSYLPQNNSQLNVVFDLSACNTRVDVPAISFSENAPRPWFNIPYNFKDASDGRIRPDSTFVTYQVKYPDNDGNTIELGQVLPDTLPNLSHGFKTSYILNQDDINKGIQKFQLLQNRPVGSNTLLNESFNCVLSAVLNLSAACLNYYGQIFQKPDSSLYWSVTGVPGSKLGVRYIVDSSKMYFSSETWQSTLSSFDVGSLTNSSLLGKPINILENNLSKSINWTTKYPPHYYSYKFSLSGGDFLERSDSCNLTFYLQSSVVNITSTSATISSYISSDHNILSYNLPDNNVKEFIKYELLSDKTLFDNGAINCFYGPNKNIPYKLNLSSWIPVSAGHILHFNYTNPSYGENWVTIRATLSSAAGYLTSYNSTNFGLAIDSTQNTIGHPIFLDYLNQGIDFFDVSAAALTADPGWPSRDLRDSNISWFYEPTYVNAKIYSIDQDGNTIKEITPRATESFSYQTYSIRLTGIDFSTVNVFLSSQKYNEVTSLSSNPSLFDPFAYKKFTVGPSVPLNNLNVTRTISLTARLPYGDYLYDIPYNTPIAWTWAYNDSQNFSNNPIKVYYGSNRTPYNFGQKLPAQELSAIYVEVTPKYNTSTPKINHVTLQVYTEVRPPFIAGDYEFAVDDFPDRSIFNSDFKIGYTNFQSSSGVILDSGINQFTLARPNDGTNIFTLSGYTNSNINPFSTYVWSISDNALGQRSPITVSYQDQTLNYTVNSNASLTTITLSALKVVVAPWSNVNILDNVDFSAGPAHNTQTTVFVYTPPAAEFNKSLEFFIYPEYAWLGGRNLTLLSSSNYTLSQIPSAYQHKKSNSQTYWVSANKMLSEYDYYIGSNVQFLSTLKSNIALLDIPYVSEFSAITGLTVNLTAFNQYYPKDTLTYFKPVNGSLATLNYQITARTGSLAVNPTLNPFKSNPLIVPYNTDAVLRFNIDTPTLDLNFSRTITLTQDITTKPLESPAQPILDSGTVTYLLSTGYWTKEITIPSIDGTFNALTLNLGDPYEQGYIKDSGYAYLALKPVRVNLPYIIPSSTFDKYNTSQYTGERNLWNVVNHTTEITDQNWQTLVAYYTAKPLEAFISSYIALTGQEIYLDYMADDETPDNNVLFYSTNFGDTDTNVISYKNESVKYKFSTAGSFYISYNAYYLDGSVKTGRLPDPILVKPIWTEYNQEGIRTLTEDSLTLPHSLEEVAIQPNEWGDVDIFNTAMGRVFDNLTYLDENIQTINTDSPSFFYGWLGSNIERKSEGIRWYIKNFGNTYYDNMSVYSGNSGSSYFSNVKDVASFGDYLFVLDDNLLRGFYNKHYKPVELEFTTKEDWLQEMVSPCSIEIDSTGTTLYVVDTPRNKVVSLNIDYDTPALNFSIYVGGYGSKDDPNKFNSPVQVVHAEDSVYVLDYNNRCVKEYTTDLNWKHTYYDDTFSTNQPISIAAHHSGMVYVLTETYKVFVFDESDTSNHFYTFDLPEILFTKEVVSKITLDSAGAFLYISTEKSIYKYAVRGYFICLVNFSVPSNSVKKDANSSLLICTSYGIAKIQDVVSLFKIGEGLPSSLWSKDQVLLSKPEMASDLNYNKSFQRMTQNLKTFRSKLISKFVKATEYTKIGVISYYALSPVAYNSLPVLLSDVENENIGVGVNELHIPQVLNREFAKLHSSIEILRAFLNISDITLPNVRIDDSGVSVSCSEPFCWSWKALSCNSLTLPAIRICNVNPITYTELHSNFPIGYAPSTLWDSASASCCISTPSPLR